MIHEMFEKEIKQEDTPVVKEEPEDYVDYPTDPNLFVKEEPLVGEEIQGPSRLLNYPPGVSQTNRIRIQRNLNAQRSIGQYPELRKEDPADKDFEKLEEDRRRATRGLPGRSRNLKKEWTEDNYERPAGNLDPWYYKVPVFRNRKTKTRVVTDSIGEPLMKATRRQVVKSAIQNPGKNSQELLEQLMTELEEAQKQEEKKETTPPKEYRCRVPGCLAIFSLPWGLRKHETLHKEQFRCAECQKTFHSRHQLEEHLEDEHEAEDSYSLIERVPGIPRTMALLQKPVDSRLPLGENIADVIKTEMNVSFVCGTTGCDGSFGSNEELRKHILLDHGGKNAIKLEEREEEMAVPKKEEPE